MGDGLRIPVRRNAPLRRPHQHLAAGHLDGACQLHSTAAASRPAHTAAAPCILASPGHREIRSTTSWSGLMEIVQLAASTSLRLLVVAEPTRSSFCNSDSPFSASGSSPEQSSARIFRRVLPWPYSSCHPRPGSRHLAEQLSSPLPGFLNAPPKGSPRRVELSGIRTARRAGHRAPGKCAGGNPGHHCRSAGGVSTSCLGVARVVRTLVSCSDPATPGRQTCSRRSTPTELLRSITSTCGPPPP